MTELFLTVLHMSLTAGYVILFLVFVRLPLKKAPKAISYALWSVAAFRLLCPLSFESILSLVPGKNSPISRNIVFRGAAQGISGSSAAAAYANPSLSVPAAKADAGSVRIWTWVWLLGIAAMLTYSVVSVRVLKSRLKDAKETERNIYEAGNLKTPFVLGIFRPKIYLPAGLPAEERNYIVRHEKTHIRRFDHVVKPAAFLILSIHWFNPLVWLAFVLMGTDMEFSCDERVIREMGGDIKKAYSASLLSLSTEKRILNGGPLAFGEGNVKGRIKNVLRYKKPAFWVVVAAVAIVVAVSVALLSNPRSRTLTQSEARKIVEEHYPAAVITPGEDQTIHNDADFDCYTFQVKPADAEPNETVAVDKKAGAFFALGKKDGLWRVFTGAREADSSRQETTAFDPSPAKWSRDQDLGTDMTTLDYASDSTVVFHGYFGLFVYDLESRQFVRTLDLQSIKCNATQGDNYCDVSVSSDGDTVQLHPISSKSMYVYTISNNTLQEKAYQRMKNPFGGIIPLTDVMGYQDCSYEAVKFANGEYGYLHASEDWTIDSLTYVRDDMVYDLFE